MQEQGFLQGNSAIGAVFWYKKGAKCPPNGRFFAIRLQKKNRDFFAQKQGFFRSRRREAGIFRSEQAIVTAANHTPEIANMRCQRFLELISLHQESQL
jgi:hypothetical protein